MFESIDWKILWDISDPDEFPELFTLFILQVCCIGCPKKVPSSKKPNSNITKLSRKKRKIQKFLTNVEENPYAPEKQVASLKRKLALVHYDIRDAVNADLQLQAVNKMKTNPEYFFSYSKKFSKKKRNISMLFDQHNQACVQPEEIANIPQRQFTSVFSDPSKTDIPSATEIQTPEIPHLFTDDVLHSTPNDISMAIDEIDSSAASGPDEIPAILLKNCKHTLAIPIHLMWQESLSSGAVPAFYKNVSCFPSLQERKSCFS